jgi:hypothetical protein
MNQHYKILGILFIVYAALTILIGFMVASFIHIIGSQHVVHEEEMVLKFVTTFIPVILIVVSIPNIIAGIGLLAQKKWALVMAVILSVFNIMSFPFGTGLSMYSIYVLVKQEEDKNRLALRREWKEQP